EFLKSLNSNGVKYLLIGGYAVGIYGHIRATNDLDVWVESTPGNATRIERALREFGFDLAALNANLFVEPNNVIRMGQPPMRIEVLTSISGVEFEECFADRETFLIDELPVPVISLAHLRQNKAASGRAKDIADLECLPQ